MIDDPAQLHALESEWLDLLGRSRDHSLMQHPHWMLPWWDVFGESGKRTLRTLAFRDNGKLVGLAPLLHRPYKHRPGIPFRRLELLASGEDEADETCSDYIGLIAADGYDAAVASAFAKALAAGTVGAWDELVLPSMNGESPLPALLQKELSAQGFHVTLEETNQCPYAGLPKTWDEYLGLLKGNKRSQLKKSLKAFEAWAGGPAKWRRVTAPAELEQGKRVLEKLHKERWESDGVYRSERYRAFHDKLMPLFLQRGELELGHIVVKDEPVVAIYNLRYGGRVYHYQTGRKLDIPDDVRIGVTMHALLIKDAIESGMREYDFLAGVSQYKMSLSFATRPLVTLRAARPSVVESARVAAVEAATQAKKLRDFAKEKLGKGKPEGEADVKAEKKELKVGRALDERVRPFYFGPESESGGALFGIYHPIRPLKGKGPAPKSAILLCPPLGYEGICAYPALRQMAEKLCALGHPVLRFDYDGTGDSGGLDSDKARVRAWVESVGHAIDELRALSNVDEVTIFGIRFGATLALKAAAERGDVERLVLWNPCASGKAYARELRAFRLFAEQTGELAARPKAEGDTSEESGGFLFTEETLKELKALDTLKLGKRAADKVLVIGRNDVPDDDKLAKSIEANGAASTYEQLGDYAEMMVAPHKSVFPESVYQRTLKFLAEPLGAEQKVHEKKAPTERKAGIVASGVKEEPFRFGPQNGFFGVVTSPTDAAKAKGKPLVIFSNTAGNYRIGPNRMYVEMGRRLAALGIPSARVDVSGIGDSIIWADEDPNHPYADRLFEDIQNAIKHLKEEKRATQFGVAGLCSGAFVAYHTAVLDPDVASIVLINLQIFAWEEGMSLEVNPLANRDQTEYYKRRMFNKEAWMKMLRGGVDIRNVVGVVQRRVVDTTKATFAKAMAKLSQDASRGSPIARAFDTLLKRNVDVLIIFSGTDPGIDNLNVKVGPSMGALKKNERFTIEHIEGVDHSFTPVWSQVELDKVLVGHLARRFG